MALALLAAASVHAETAVGLDARGVDPMVALDNRMGLDVRDELGRSVTAAAVTKDLSRARARRVVEGAFTSRLPKAREILPLLDLARGRAFSLVSFFDLPPWRHFFTSLPSPAPKLWLLMLALPGFIVAVTVRTYLPQRRLIALREGRCCPEVLRC